MMEQIKAESTDSGKTRLLLESMRPGLSNCNNATFLKFLEAMKQYGDCSKTRLYWISRQIFAKIYLEFFFLIFIPALMALPSSPISS